MNSKLLFTAILGLVAPWQVLAELRLGAGIAVIADHLGVEIAPVTKGYILLKRLKGDY